MTISHTFIVHKRVAVQIIIAFGRPSDTRVGKLCEICPTLGIGVWAGLWAIIPPVIHVIKLPGL